MQSEREVNGMYADVSPESYKEETNYGAFQDTESLSQDIFPANVTDLLEDRANWKNRAQGVTAILHSVREVKDATLLQKNATALLGVLTNCLNDPHFKIVLITHEVLEEVINKIGPALADSLKLLVGCLVGKMGDNKFVTKQANMKVFMQLMQVLKPQQVVTEVLSCGLRHKISRVREETINVVIASLLTFPRTEFDLLMLAKEVAPSLVDNKQRVRQASLEVFALLAHSLGKGHLQPLVSAVASVERSYFAKEPEPVNKTEGGSLFGVMVAFQARLARRQLAHLSNDGLVVHAVNVTNTRGTVPFSGADVDWILAAGNSGLHSCTPSAVRRRSLHEMQNNPTGANTSQAIIPVPNLRPYRSAGKRLPWEIDNQDKEKDNSVKEDKPTNLGAVIPPKPRIPPTSVLTANGSNNMVLNHKDTSYAKQHLSRLKSNQELPLGVENKLSSSLNSIDPYGQVKNGMMTTRHSSLPSDLNHADTRTVKPIFANGSPVHSLLPNGLSLPQEDGLSVTWPKRHPQGPGRKIPLPIKGHLETTGDMLSQHPVKPTIGRPSSKPRSHNPLLNSIRLSAEATAAGAANSSSDNSPVEEVALSRRNNKIRNTIDTELLKDKVQVHNGLPLNSKVKQLDTVMRTPHENWGEDFEDIYEDEFEGNSLCSSVASLLYKEHELSRNSDLEKPKLRRQQVASKKQPKLLPGDPALLDSTDCLSTNNSPQSGTPPVVEQEGVQPKRSHSGEEKRSKPLEKVNKLKHLKTQSAGTAASSKTQSSLKDTSAATSSHNDDVKVENISPDTSPQHQSTNKPTDASLLDKTFTKQEVTDGDDSSTVQNTQGTHNTRRAVLNREKDRITQKPSKKETEVATGGKTSVKTVPLQRDRPKELTGYAARYFQKRATEHTTKPTEKDLVLTAGVLDFDRPLLSPATRESMAKKRRCSDKQTTDDSMASSQNNNVTSISAPVRRTKPTSLASDERHSASVTFSDTIDGNGHNNTVDHHDILTLEDLKPFQHPDQALRDCQQSLSNSDWNAKCDGLLTIRRLGAFHPEVLASQFHVIILSILTEVKNLRSQVARAAISCLADLFSCCGKMLEQDLDEVVKVLLLKGGESSVFIREDVERALAEMVSVITPSRCLVALVNGGLRHRSVAVKRSMSCFISASLERFGAGKFLHCSKDVLDKVLPALIQLTTDPSPEARYYARYSLNLLLSHPDFDKTISRVFTTQQSLSKCKEVIENLKNKGVGDFPTDVQSARKRSLTSSFNSRASHSRSQDSRSGAKATPNHKQRHSAGSTIGCEQPVVKKPSRKIKSETKTRVSANVDAALPEELLSRLKSTEWKERYQGVTELEQLIDNGPQALGPHIVKVFDAFLPRLTDANSKVNLHALEAFSNMVPLLGDLLLPIVTNIVEALVPNLASKQATIHDTAETVLELITQCIAPAPLAQPIANAAQYGNSRIQPIMLERLAYLVPFIQTQRPQTVIRHMLPVLFHFVAAKMPPTGQTRLSLLMLCAALDSCLGPELFEHAHHLSPEQLSKLKELMNSATKP